MGDSQVVARVLKFERQLEARLYRVGIEYSQQIDKCLGYDRIFTLAAC